MSDKLAGQIQAEAETAIRDLKRVFGEDGAVEMMAALLNPIRAYGLDEAMGLFAVTLLKERIRR